MKHSILVYGILLSVIGIVSVVNVYGLLTAFVDNVEINPGKLSVGTSYFDPDSQLFVVSNTQIPFKLQSSNAIGTEFNFASTAPGGREFTIGSTANGAGPGPGKLTFVDRTAGPLIRMVVDSTGKVGIGNNSPAQILDVGGNIGLTGNIVGEGSTTFKIIPPSGQDICIGTGC